jgi:hypothetical protein
LWEMLVLLISVILKPNKRGNDEPKGKRLHKGRIKEPIHNDPTKTRRVLFRRTAT